MDRIPMPSALLSHILLPQDLRQKQVVIGHRGRSQTIYPSSTPRSMKTQHILATLVVFLFTSIFSTASPNVRSFIDGQQKKYKTIDNPKANGLNLIIAYPEDWLPKEGNGPHIVQKFVSENGRGTENVSILIKDTQLDPPTIAEMEEAFNPSNLKHFAPENAKIIKMESSKVEGLPCGIIEYTVEGEMRRLKKDKCEQTDEPNPYACGTSGMAPASASRAGAMPEASRDRSSGTFGKKQIAACSTSL